MFGVDIDICLTRLGSINTMFTVRTDSKLKTAAQSLAGKLGIPISAIVNNSLKEFVFNRRVVFAEPLVPNARTRARLNKKMINIEQGKNLTGSSYSADDFLKSLRS